LGSKRKWITPEQTDELVRLYEEFKEGANSKIYPNNFFGYTKVVVEQPLIEDGKLKKDKSGHPKPDTSKRDHERIPLSDSIDDYYEREVKPHLSDSWMDRSKDKVGYEINFTKYFYTFTPQRSVEQISIDIESLDAEIRKLSSGLTK
jgi:type I restriction enzyme M protein